MKLFLIYFQIHSKPVIAVRCFFREIETQNFINIRSIIFFSMLLGLSISDISSSQSVQSPAINVTTFAIIGDYGSGSQNEQRVANMINTWNVDFIITTGDNNYPDGEASTIDDNIGQFYVSWIGNYQGSYGTGSSSNKFFPSLGNHDWHTANAQPYLDYFTLPGSGFTNSSGVENYYDFVWDNIHFFVLDSESIDPGGEGPDPDQEQWIQVELTNCDQNHLLHWRIVYFHHPPYCTEYWSGGHGNQTFMQLDYVGMGAHAVLAGHAHKYERLIIGGLDYFVNGVGGKGYTLSKSPIDGSQYIYGADFGAQRVIVDGTEMNFEFWSIGTDFSYEPQLLDTWTITDGNLPVELKSFTGEENKNEVILNWETATEINNFGFDIERSEDLANWVAIGFVEGQGNSNSPKHYYYIDKNIRRTGNYYYRLKQIDNDGKYEYSEVVLVEVSILNKFHLSQNYPNPFNPTTNIRYTISNKQSISLKVYDVLGNEIAVLANDEKPAGTYEVKFDGNELTGGIYFYRIQAGDFVETKKMVLMK